MLTAFIMTHISKLDLSEDPIYQERLKEGLVKPPVGLQEMVITSDSKTFCLDLPGRRFMCSCLRICYFAGSWSY